MKRLIQANQETDFKGEKKIPTASYSTVGDENDKGELRKSKARWKREKLNK